MKKSDKMTGSPKMPEGYTIPIAEMIPKIIERTVCGEYRYKSLIRNSLVRDAETNPNSPGY